MSPSTGSSPLARGLPRSVGPPDVNRGIIPARAGFTLGVDVLGMLVQDHPRSRGVYELRGPQRLRAVGSSPLARGLLGSTGTCRRPWRIIPARAGFTRSACGPRNRGPDHPRSRGVYSQTPWIPGIKLGSSPLARGLHLRILGIPTMSHPTRPRLPSLLT